MAKDFNSRSKRLQIGGGALRAASEIFGLSFGGCPKGCVRGDGYDVPITVSPCNRPIDTKMRQDN